MKSDEFNMEDEDIEATFNINTNITTIKQGQYVVNDSIDFDSFIFLLLVCYCLMPLKKVKNF